LTFENLAISIHPSQPSNKLRTPIPLRLLTTLLTFQFRGIFYKMLPATSILRTVRVLFPSFSSPLRQATSTSSRSFTCLTTSSQMLRRPTIQMLEHNGKIGEQIRGMKVRSSVKKLCEGCKVYFLPGKEWVRKWLIGL